MDWMPISSVPPSPAYTMTFVFFPAARNALLMPLAHAAAAPNAML